MKEGRRGAREGRGEKKRCRQETANLDEARPCTCLFCCGTLVGWDYVSVFNICKQER